MASPAYDVRRIGREAQPLVVLDDFAANPDALRAAAAAETFEPAAHHYPGVRGALPATYLSEQMPLIAQICSEVFGLAGAPRVIDASFSIVTTPPDRLTIPQRLPHCDAFTRTQIALLHYLAPGDAAGTGFYRHRSTGFESVDEARRPIFFDQLDAELRIGGPPPQAFVDGDTPLFERIAAVEARYNRALLYPGYLLHSGAILPGAALSADPAQGRLTITGFLATG